MRERFITTELSGYVHVFWREESCNPFGNCWPRLAYKHSTNDGETWSDTVIFRDIPTQVLSIATTASSNAIHVVYDTYDIGQWIEYRRSTNHGLSWSNPVRLSPQGFQAGGASLTAYESTVYFSFTGSDPSGNWGIFCRKSLDDGLSWQAVSPLLAPAGTRSSIAASGNTVHLTWTTFNGYFQRLWYRRSTDNGTTWLPSIMLAPDTATGYYSLAADGSHAYVVWAGGGWVQYNGMLLRRSTDAGATWEPITQLVPYYPEYFQTPVIVASGPSVHAFWAHQDTTPARAVLYKRSANYGITWEPEIEISQRGFYTAFGHISAAILGTTVHAAWSDSAGPLGLSDIFYSRYPFGNVTSIQDHAISPIEFSLHQNYPNPFNPTTKIRFTLPRSEFVSLKIYNLLGQELSTLLSEKMSLGTHEVEWTAQNLPSGIYFYRLQAGTFTDMKKLVLIR